MNSVFSVKKTLFRKRDDQRDPCNENCYKEFKKDVFQSTPRGQPGKGCRYNQRHLLRDR
jgi:hypothetical protein